MSKQDIEKRLGFAAQGVKAKFGRFNTEFGFLANQIKNQPDLAKKNIIVLAKKMGNESDITGPEFEQLVQYAEKLGMSSQVINAYDSVHPGFSRTGAKAKFVRIVTTPQGRYTTNLDKNTRAPIEGGNGYVMVDPAQYITPKRVRVQGTKGEIEVQAIVEGKEIVGVSAKLVSARSGAKAKMALTIYTVGAKNACYEALANLGVLAKLASDTKSGWDFHVTVMIDHVKSAMSQLDSSPAQAGTHLERAINTLGMLRKIDPVRLNDIQKGSLKQLIGYVAKSLRDARANIKVVTTASRPGVKAKMGRAEKVLSDGSVSLDFTEAKEWLSTVSDEALKYIISDSNAAAKAMGSGGKKFNYYTDLALTAAQMLRSTKRGGHRLNSSRPSAKAKMENSDGNYFSISGYVDNSILGNRTFDTQAEAEYYGKVMLEFLKKNNLKAKDVNVQISKVVKYKEQAPFKTLSLRPSAKAKA